jgi:copper chaperone CopZ
MRQQYVAKTHQLLGEKGKLVGLLFNRDFEGGPPFGGNQNEYENLFKEAFHFNNLSTAQNSVAPRANTELFIEFEKNNSVEASIYDMSGITCNSCKNTITEKLVALENVLNANINTALNKLLIVNKPTLKFEQLEEVIAYDKKYKITKQ